MHVCDMGLPPDIMHDILEGIVPYTTKLMLHHFIDEEKMFTLDTLNTILRDFNFGYLEVANKPSQIQVSTFHSQDKTNLGQSGRQEIITIYVQ